VFPLLLSSLPSSFPPFTGRIPDDVLQRLDFLFSGDAVLERALEHLDGRDVVRLRAPSGRSCFLVGSASAKGGSSAGGRGMAAGGG
jgi:hypothetical protein